MGVMPSFLAVNLDIVYLPKFRLFALLDLSPALPYSAREEMWGNIGVRPAQTYSFQENTTPPTPTTPPTHKPSTPRDIQGFIIIPLICSLTCQQLNVP